MMTKKQMEELADMITSKIILELFGDDPTRAESKLTFNNDFTEKTENIMPIGTLFPDMSNEELLIGELARLQTILMIYEDREEYEKAARVLKKLRVVQTKLNEM